MVDKTLPALDAVATPVATDILLTRQAADTEDRRMTRAQARQLLAGEQYDGTNAASAALLNEAATATNPTLVPNKADLDTGIGWQAADQGVLIAGGAIIGIFQEAPGALQFIVPQQNNVAAPSIAFGDGDTGFYELADDNITVAIAGIAEWQMNAFNFGSSSSSRPIFRNVAMTATVPGIIPRLNDLNTGIGGVGSDSMSLIAGGVEVATVFEAGGVPQLILPQVNAAVTPTLAFGDGDSGIFESADDTLQIVIGGLSHCLISSTWIFRAILSNGPGMLAQDSTDTVPNVLPNRDDTNTGLGTNGVDVGVLIAGGVNVLEFGEIAAAPALGFYGTAALVQQTGVAVTDVAIHAALVNLGLITA